MDMYNQNGVSTWMGFTLQSTSQLTDLLDMIWFGAAMSIYKGNIG